MNKTWAFKASVDESVVTKLANELSISPILSKLLVQRGIDSYSAAETFFLPEKQALHDSFSMKNMTEAVALLATAIVEEQKIMLFGDYDVDGTTAVASMYLLLKDLSKKLSFYIPDRYKEGYGLSKDGIIYAKNQGIQLLITLDCGIKDVELISFARDLGLKVIVCDHHQPGEQIPDAIILNPKQKECTYPFKELSGCGVGFKLMTGLYQKLKIDQMRLFKVLDLVALSIAADIVSITEENRILMKRGLDVMNENPRLSFQKMISSSNKKFPLSTADVVFGIAPRINAAGRIHTGEKAVALLIAEDENEIDVLVKSIELDNQERRLIDEEITKEALGLIQKDVDFHQKKSTVLFNENWHKGVVGIVASRIIEHHYKPTIILTKSENKWTGSARSVKDFNLYDALSLCSEYLDQFGGHAFAAGMTISNENLIPFIHKFDEVTKNELKSIKAIEILEIDTELKFSELFEVKENRFEVPKFKRIIDRFAPFGPGNMTPVFLTKNLKLTQERVLKDKHLKAVFLEENSGIQFDGIAFNFAQNLHDLIRAPYVDLVYTLETNTWNGKESIQLMIKDIKVSQ